MKTGINMFSIRLLIRKNDQPASGTDQDVIAAIVVDSSGTAVEGQQVTWSVDSGASLSTTINPGITGADGQATAYVTQTTGGNVNVIATLADGTSVTLPVTFIASALTEGDLTDFKADVASFVTYIEQQLDSVSQEVNAALTQLGASVTQSNVSAALVAFKTNVQTFNDTVQQSVATLDKNATRAFTTLTNKYV
jgi:hypothetical protein